ncbi:uncharacterized protein LOC108816320 [Raphanus sativus]|uniref:Uncharacterized protein LOC108816320 n=1 Tax=Raphanus sativus TaxID=3726 RepID=A0A9W3DU65_RAPSA|nr:uncharacterized protein LOC108816320 [Raphanus sativus]
MCSKKVQEISSFTCVVCNVTNAVAALRYRVKLSASDSTDTTSILPFDVEMAKLTSIHASEAAQIVGIGVDARVDTDLPGCLADIERFPAQVERFQLSFKHQTFTISRIFPQRALTPMPAFAIADGINVPEVALPGAVATGTIVDVGEPRTAVDGLSASDVSTGKRPAPARRSWCQ